MFMIELSKKTERFFGSEASGYECKRCRHVFAISGDLETLPPEFEARCPVCNEKGIYRRDEIQTLDAHTKQ
jgi:hypothetical protein